MTALRRSITVRLVAMFALAALATFSLSGAALYQVLERELTRHQDQDLDTNLQSLRYFIERTGDTERWARVRAKMDSLTPADDRIRFWVLCDDPRFQYGHDLDRIEQFSDDADGRGGIRLPQEQHTWRTNSLRIEAFGQRPAVRLIIGLDTGPFQHTLRRFLVALAVVSLGAMVLVMLLGYWIARLGLQPLQQLSREAQGLRPTTLSQRLQTARLPPELSDLATAFNGALGRLEVAYQQLEAFNADVAHELRTPLANLIGGTQVALSRQRSAGEFQETLQSNLEELERLRSIINDMLFLARADRGEEATGLVETCVADEVAKTIEFFEFILDESRLAISVDGDLQARARLSTALFRRALSNLLQNAVEHAPAGSALRVTILQQSTPGAPVVDGGIATAAAAAAATATAASAVAAAPSTGPGPGLGWVWIGVSNPGNTIAADHLPRLFDRFYRVDASRHGVGEHHGHGLGLAIVKAVATMHGGDVAAESGDGRTTIGFSVRSLQAAG